MLKITIDGDPEKSYEVDNARMSNKEAKAIERFTGQRISKFQNIELATSDADHATVLVWLGMRRNGTPDVGLDDVEFDMNLTTIEVVEDPTDSPAPDAPPDPTSPPEDISLNPSGDVTG